MNNALPQQPKPYFQWNQQLDSYRKPEHITSWVEKKENALVCASSRDKVSTLWNTGEFLSNLLPLTKEKKEKKPTKKL